MYLWAVKLLLRDRAKFGKRQESVSKTKVPRSIVPRKNGVKQVDPIRQLPSGIRIPNMNTMSHGVVQLCD
eukprot:m.52108 g.52108  ORF g.52108 m.52108 type:complete len:70 (+) comp10773_c0_seq2:2016-2225(+)